MGSSAKSGEYVGRNYARDEIPALIEKWGRHFGLDESGLRLAVRIAYCESGFNHLAKNRSSTASGVFQYLASTWANTEEGRSGLSVFDAEANVKAATRHLAVHDPAPWNASIHCWSKH